MTRIRCRDRHCTFNKNGICTSEEIEYEPDAGCLTMEPREDEEEQEDWEEEEELDDLNDDLEEEDEEDEDEDWDEDEGETYPPRQRKR